MADPAEKMFEIFCTALDLESDDARETYLFEACGRDSQLRDEVLDLLKAHSRRPETFLEHSPPALDPDSDATTAPSLDREESELGLPGEFPRRFGHYELLEAVAHGGMGIVYRARDSRLDRSVALKMILAGKLASEEELKRFELEARAAGALSHPGIVPVHEVGCHEGHQYIAMGFVDGSNLAEVLKKGPLDPMDAARLLRKVALAIQAAHDEGILHRDLKPGNILLDSKGDPKVADFGLAKQVEGASDLTSTGMVVGTPSYMAPEQASGRIAEVHVASDVYALGALLYAMLTGRPPFKGDGQLDTLLQVVQGNPVPPRQRNRSVPRELEAICLKCLELEAINRYSSAADLADDLGRFLKGEPVVASRDWNRRIRKWAFRRPVLAAHLGATVIMMATVIVNTFLLSRDGPDLPVMWTNLGIMSIWGLVVMGLQFAQDFWKTKLVIPYIWAALNPVFLTWILVCNDPPRGALLSLFLVLLIFECFLRRYDLVIVTTIGSVLGVALLIAISFREELEGNAISYLVVNIVSLAFSGILLSILTFRLQQLTQSRQD